MAPTQIKTIKNNRVVKNKKNTRETQQEQHAWSAPDCHTASSSNRPRKRKIVGQITVVTTSLQILFVQGVSPQCRLVFLLTAQEEIWPSSTAGVSHTALTASLCSGGLLGSDRPAVEVLGCCFGLVAVPLFALGFGSVPLLVPRFPLSVYFRLNTWRLFPSANPIVRTSPPHSGLAESQVTCFTGASLWADDYGGCSVA